MPDIPSITDTTLRHEEMVTNEYRTGVWRAFVTSVDDPEGRGRVRVWVPELHHSTIKEDGPWAEPAFPFGGSSDYGFLMLPQRGASVWVAFEQGYIGRPVLVGAWYGDGERPSEHTPSESYVLKTPDGHKMVLDEAGTGIITIEHSNEEQKVEINGDGVTTIRNNTSQDSVVLDRSSITINQGGNTLVLTQSGDLTITISGDATVVAGGDITATATGDITATSVTGDVDVTATAGSVSATAVAGSATVSAATTVDITATTGPVNVNTVGAINLGTGSTQGLVLGNAFKTFFDGHTHSSSGTGPPTTAMDATPGTHISATVRTKT